MIKNPYQYGNRRWMLGSRADFIGEHAKIVSGAHSFFLLEISKSLNNFFTKRDTHNSVKTSPVIGFHLVTRFLARLRPKSDQQNGKISIILWQIKSKFFRARSNVIDDFSDSSDLLA